MPGLFFMSVCIVWPSFHCGLFSALPACLLPYLALRGFDSAANEDSDNAEMVG